MASKQRAPMSLRLSEELNRRLEECAAELKVKKHTLAQDAIEAAVEAIEANDYRLVVPIEFKVSHIPTASSAEPDPEAVAGAVADHIFKESVVGAVSSGEGATAGADPGHTSGKDAIPSTREASGAQPQEPRARSSQRKERAAASKHKRIRSARKP